MAAMNQKQLRKSIVLIVLHKRMRRQNEKVQEVLLDAENISRTYLIKGRIPPVNQRNDAF